MVPSNSLEGGDRSQNLTWIGCREMWTEGGKGRNDEMVETTATQQRKDGSVMEAGGSRTKQEFEKKKNAWDCRTRATKAAAREHDV